MSHKVFELSSCWSVALYWQVLHDVGGTYFAGVNYCAMSKYKEPKTKEQWDTVVKNLKVRLLKILSRRRNRVWARKEKLCQISKVLC